MEKIAFISGQTVVYWSSILVVLGAVAAIFAFLALHLHKSGRWVGSMLLVALAVLLGTGGARLLHWYGYSAEYDNLWSALTDFSSGGFVLTGAMAGCLLAAVLLSLVRLLALPQALDCMALAGLLGITVGRLGSLFNASDRGALLDASVGFPVASACINAVTGQEEYHFSTFFFQAAGCMCILIILLVWYLPKKTNPGVKHGDACLLVMLLYCALEIVLDSTRYDSLYLRSNGFVSLVQILCAPGMLVGAVLFAVRLVRSRGWRYWYIALWIGQLAMLGGTGYMEYYVQRHGDQALFAYSIMTACLAVYVCLTVVQYSLQCRKSQKSPAEVNP